METNDRKMHLGGFVWEKSFLLFKGLAASTLQIQIYLWLLVSSHADRACVSGFKIHYGLKYVVWVLGRVTSLKVNSSC